MTRKHLRKGILPMRRRRRSREQEEGDKQVSYILIEMNYFFKTQ